ncbi:efflux transporter outer membrane subunit [Paraburkholderia caballeronis]|uniref:Efflux transporter, outer membrane factor (OMF) lipoprotein, NodT family n=1 Tax=Paraburkholderia caballeronis TaxID=416943 RepID=A0A1H7V8X9_9BURK|nr:efflux transporter outer membrane subunit [Paraburkholderia caballeronis]PXW16483.1 NodT family efflux transporter outer membrane factor (OMF) lipoprotein [Paraburkholderia caballeronis]PXW94240.1 NodT family efflux transporter outer membrane factor (OMF) lipoprotein [Paraburkholderia caballeronis]RAJ89733.1 NodT family efflux transporter outer membrane factor (OMF) lipoprotein [Paraburkholderia caballeronis]SED93678.1 efflux transporter, outer membrane factor (OMF) lipoprotein, NodT family 
MHRSSNPARGARTVLAAAASALAAALLAACAVQPATHANLADTVGATAPAAWRIDAPQDAVDARTWWAQFGDATLNDLVATVLTGNLDIQAAAERVKQADAITKQRRAVLLPQLDFTAQAVNERQNTPPPLGYVRQAGAGLALSWAPDVFGGERLDLLAAQANLVGQQHALDAVRLALAANTASAYVDLRWAQAELKILRDNTSIRERALQLTRQRLKFGLSTQLDVARAQTQLDELQARIPRAQATIDHQLNLIAIYTGRTPESVATLALATPAPVPAAAGSVPQLLPSQALLRRPDVLAAYATVQQRAAEVGVARADRYPKFSLNLTDGILASSYLGLPTLTDNLFGAALSATSPIFNAGRITAEIGQSESRMRESQLNLRQTLLQALREVEDSRSDLVSATTQTQHLTDAVASSGQALTLANRLYKGGATDFLDVLTAQQTYLADAELLNQAQREHALAAVALYRSLGGGWSEHGDVIAPDAVAARD